LLAVKFVRQLASLSGSLAVLSGSLASLSGSFYALFEAIPAFAGFLLKLPELPDTILYN